MCPGISVGQPLQTLVITGRGKVTVTHVPNMSLAAKFRQSCRQSFRCSVCLTPQVFSGPAGRFQLVLWLEATCRSKVLCVLLLPEIEAKYDKKMKMLRDELDLRRKTEIHEVEERKNGQINTLMQRHEEAFTDIKNYYNDITLNNLALINSLKVLMSSGRRADPAFDPARSSTPYCNDSGPCPSLTLRSNS